VLRQPSATEWIALAVFAVLVVLPLGVGAYPVRLATVIFMWAALAGAWNLLAGYAGSVDLGPVVHYGVGGPSCSRPDCRSW
jgi:branched-chain amino acid transport system permease protein